jgi:hypothetical protein
MQIAFLLKLPFALKPDPSPWPFCPPDVTTGTGTNGKKRRSQAAKTKKGRHTRACLPDLFYKND